MENRCVEISQTATVYIMQAPEFPTGWLDNKNRKGREYQKALIKLRRRTTFVNAAHSARGVLEIQQLSKYRGALAERSAVWLLREEYHGRPLRWCKVT